MKNYAVLKLILVAALIIGIGFVVAGKNDNDSEKGRVEAKKVVKKDAVKTRDRAVREEGEGDKPWREKRDIEAKDKEAQFEKPKMKEEFGERVRIAIDNLRAAGFPDIAERVEREIDARLAGGKRLVREPLKNIPQPPAQPFRPHQPGVMQPMPAPTPMAGEQFKRLENQVAELKEQMRRLDERLDKLAQERK
ncbi:MAG: hypothetical protein ACP5T0_10845 [Verrucomicrobiia bacterium]